jgi:putative membrane protein
MLEQFAQYYRTMPMERTMHGDDNDWIVLVVFGFFALLVAVGLLIVYKLFSSKAASQNKSPIDIAKERYAKGDITKEELADIKKELSAK